MENTENQNTERVGISSTTLFDILCRLAEKLIWIAPVGNDDSYQRYDGSGKYTPIPALRGFMVCKRSVNNVDGKNTRVDFLLTDASQRWRWKKPFRECECMFPTMEEAIISAANAAGISLSNDQRTTNTFAEIASALRQEEAVRLAILGTVARALDELPENDRHTIPLLAVHRMAATGLRSDDPRPEPLNIANAEMRNHQP